MNLMNKTQMNLMRPMNLMRSMKSKDKYKAQKFKNQITKFKYILIIMYNHSQLMDVEQIINVMIKELADRLINEIIYKLE